MKQIGLYRVIECNFVTTSSNILTLLKRKPEQDSEKKEKSTKVHSPVCVHTLARTNAPHPLSVVLRRYKCWATKKVSSRIHTASAVS